jgi:serine protease AprX
MGNRDTDISEEIIRARPTGSRIAYHHLRVPADVATVLRAVRAHKQGVTGAGVVVAMPDAGFYRHPFYEWHAYRYNATLSPDAMRMEHDEVDARRAPLLRLEPATR